MHTGTPGVDSLLYELDPPVGAVLGPAYNPDTFVFNDLMPAGASLFVSDNANPVVYRMDLATGALQETINLSRAGSYIGLANADPLMAPVPEPGAAILLGAGLLGMGAVRRRTMREPVSSLLRGRGARRVDLRE